MPENLVTKRSTGSKRTPILDREGENKIQISRLQLATAAIALLSSLVLSVMGVYRASADSGRISEVYRMLKSSDSLRASLARPLEGLWDYEVRYDRFHGAQNPTMRMKGKAILSWDKGGYRVFVAGSVKDKNSSVAVVTSVSTGLLPAGENGSVVEPFRMRMKYEARTGLPAYANSTRDDFEYFEGKLMRGEDEGSQIMMLKFDTSEGSTNTGTIGMVYFMRPSHL